VNTFDSEGPKGLANCSQPPDPAFRNSAGHKFPRKAVAVNMCSLAILAQSVRMQAFDLHPLLSSHRGGTFTTWLLFITPKASAPKCGADHLQRKDSGGDTP